MLPTCCRIPVLMGILALAVPSALRAEDKWIDLSTLDAWKQSTTGWRMVGGVALDPKDAKKLVDEPGSGVMYNGPNFKGSKNLVTKEPFGDVEIHAEFNVPKGSNSGIKFQT